MWNRACDYAINPILLDAGLTLPDGFLLNERYRGKSADAIYELLAAEKNDNQKKRGPRIQTIITKPTPGLAKNRNRPPGKKPGRKKGPPKPPMTPTIPRATREDQERSGTCHLPCSGKATTNRQTGTRPLSRQQPMQGEWETCPQASTALSRTGSTQAVLAGASVTLYREFGTVGLLLDYPQSALYSPGTLSAFPEKQ